MRTLALLLILAPLPAAAADRTVSVTTFTRVRVEGPFAVEVRTGASPSAKVSGDARAIERIDVSQSGDTLTVRPGGAGWGERGDAQLSRPVTIVLGTPRLDGVAIGAGAEVRTGAARGTRVDLTVTGAGKLSVERVEADRLVATVVGTGVLTAAGKVGTARLMVSGTGAVTAPELVAGDLTARVEGSGELTAAARFTAEVTTTGLGRVTVLGTPKCRVRAVAGGPVSCGKGVAGAGG